ncbi:MAG: cell division protein FtsX [Clostridiales bacterium GWC2_40_7]|nr:MAG: cell division protein FtsX [Clostridiales bacterium GWC2_40_7]
MRIRTARYIIKEGIVNTYRNILMSLASIMIVIATLVVFGFFLLIAMNLELNISVFKELPELEVFCYVELDDNQVSQVEESVKNNIKVSKYDIVTKLQAFEKMEERFGEDSIILDGYDESIFPVSFIIYLKDPSQSAEVVDEFKNVSGVEKVSYHQQTIDMISKVTYWMRFISGFMIMILLIISVFIISNTIKITVFARRREINIMKFIGATDWFIRWPFVVEGVIIGILGAAIAFILSGIGYNALENRFNQDLLSLNLMFFKMLKISDVWAQLVLYYSVIGVVVGAVGSFLSIRKYLRV